MDNRSGYFRIIKALLVVITILSAMLLWPQAVKPTPTPEPTRDVVLHQASTEIPAKVVLMSRVRHTHKISATLAAQVVDAAMMASEARALPPELVLAVMAAESSFRTEVVSNKGAVGLMQVLPKWHQTRIAKLSEGRTLTDPEANALIGADILVEYLAREKGDIRKALLRYNGATSAQSDYPDKVIAYWRVFRQEV